MTSDTTIDATDPSAKSHGSQPIGLPPDGACGHYRTIFVLLWIMMLSAAAAALPRRSEPESVPPSLAKINPNVAVWSELTVLPQIGESTARKIIRFRESAARTRPAGRANRVFSCAADLARVHGIGPKTVQRIAPYLRFDEP